MGAIEIREKALEIAEACRELCDLLDADPECSVLHSWNWIEMLGDDIFNELANEIEDKMLIIEDDC